MSNLKETRDRINSIASIMKITSAMKMVSASKLKRSQNLNLHLRLYWEHLESIHKKLIVKKTALKLNHKLKSSKILFIIIGSNRGLCGPFNNFILKEFEKIAKKNQDYIIQILPIGKKIATSLSKKYQVYKDKSEIFDKISLETCEEIIEDLKMQYKNHFFSSIKIIYNYPKSTSVSQVKIEDLFYLDQESIRNSLDFILEPPSREMIFESLQNQKRKIQLYKALVESATAEHAARMMSMHKATENATELKSELSLTYNKARQASITKEIIEISSQS